MGDEQRVRYEMPRPGIARLVLARPDMRNAQDRPLLYELNACFDRAAQDDDIRVIILAADGPDFSSGHDLRDRSSMGDFVPVTCCGNFDALGAEGYMAMEEEYYLGLSWRWRNIPKPTIAQVQGRAIAGALMLIWPCDLVVAAANATFSDPVVALGLNGVELFAHVWELGARRAKDLLFTGRAMTASEAHHIGMVSRVVPQDRLEVETLDLAETIASRPSMGVKLAKMAANQSLEAQGLWTAVQAAFALHQVGHSHNMQVHGRIGDPNGVKVIRELSRGMTETHMTQSVVDP